MDSNGPHIALLNARVKRSLKLQHIGAPDARMAVRIALTSCFQATQTLRRRPGSASTVQLSSDRFFGALDGRELRRGARTWRLEVYSICADARNRWLQVALLGEPSYTLTVKATRERSPKELVHAIACWLAQMKPGDDVVVEAISDVG